MTKVLFDPKTARPHRAKFGNSSYSVWCDAEGNFQLFCNTTHNSGRVYVPEQTLKEFEALQCSGCKSVRLRNPHSLLDRTSDLDALMRPALQVTAAGANYYLFGPNEEQERYPAQLGSLDGIM